jgi:transglutaminase-like putative cysteine protease
MNAHHLCIINSLTAVLVCAFAARAAEPEILKTRSFRLTYSVSITGLQPGQNARVWLPVPPNNDQQRVAVAEQRLPGASRQAREKKYANDILFVEVAADSAGRIDTHSLYEVTRHEARAQAPVMTMDDPLVALFLQPDALVPIDGKPLTLLAGKSLPMDQLRLGRTLYDIVNTHMRYSKEGTGWGHGDAVWACDSKYGNCSDFHSLFISLSRSQGVPAKFEIGFPLPPQRGRGEIAGYHCWAWFKPVGHGWVPVDISEANKNPQMREYYFGNLTEDRVTFSVGRDLILEPPQAGPPLNFFVMPYVEVAGRPHPAEKVQLKLQYEDVEGRP